jgi:hypothetical protein
MWLNLVRRLSTEAPKKEDPVIASPLQEKPVSTASRRVKPPTLKFRIFDLLHKTTALTLMGLTIVGELYRFQICELV